LVFPVNHFLGIPKARQNIPTVAGQCPKNSLQIHVINSVKNHETKLLKI